MRNKELVLLISIGCFFGIISLVFGYLNFSRKKSTNNNSSSFKEELLVPTNQDTKNIQNTKYVYQNKNTNFNTYFPDNFNDTDSNIKFEKDNSSIAFFPINGQSTKSKNINGEIIYPKIYQNGSQFIDLKYAVNSSQLIENYILNQKQTVPLFQQKVILINTYPVINNDKIDFYEPGTNKFLWSIPAPFMYEQNNPSIKNSGVKLNLECEDKKISLKNCRNFIFTKEITSEGKNWLDDSSRNYPVVIDPPVGTSCWGLSNSCDVECNKGGSGITTATVYTSCSSSACDGNCWSSGGVCESGCSTGSVASGTYYPTYGCGGAAVTRYTGSGGCSGSCYYLHGGVASYYKSTSCEVAVSTYGTSDTCYWMSQKYYYTASGSNTKYSSNGTACDSGGYGTCYKFTNGTSFYSGDGACGSSTCPSGTYYDRTACTWYADPIGVDIKLEGLKIEGIKFN